MSPSLFSRRGPALPQRPATRPRLVLVFFVLIFFIGWIFFVSVFFDLLGSPVTWRLFRICSVRAAWRDRHI